MKTTPVFLVLALLTASLASASGPCPPIGGEKPVDDPTKPAPLFEGLGVRPFPITTDSPEAQRYFDQGLALAYGFNHAEASRSFREAAELDPDCAMAWWGVALVLGPNVNAPMMPEAVADAWQALNKAHEFAHLATDKEKALIGALQKRYVEQPGDDRAALDAAYRDAMREVAKAYPDDAHVLALFAEAAMDCHPWNFWDRKTFEPHEWTPEIVDAIERGLAIDNQHPGLNHLYIHAVEGCANPDRANVCADRLGAIAPGSGHLVHMPSHIYIRTGRYHDGSIVNENAIIADDGYTSVCHAQGVYPLVYRLHNHHFLWATSTIEGQSKKAVTAAKNTASLVEWSMIRDPMLGGILQHWSMIPTFGMVRFGWWDEILLEKKPEKDLLYMNAVYHYARGLAYERTGKPKDADKELRALEKIAKDKTLADVKILGENSAAQLVSIAERVLGAEIASSRGKHDQAVKLLREAVAIEDELQYAEPADWFFPVRQNLGAVLLAAGRPQDAEAVYREDLFVYPDNAWSLMGLKLALEAQGKAPEASEVAARFAKAWEHADFQLTASRM
jgi:tetratricopeptide (TPR) repeat protein